MRVKTERRAWKAFRSSAAMEKTPITPEDAKFILGEVRRLFPYRHFRIKVQFMKGATGPFGRYGDARYRTNTIRIWKNGRNLETLLHEIAHLLAPRTPGRHHNKDFYYTCDLLERELF